MKGDDGATPYIVDQEVVVYCVRPRVLVRRKQRPARSPCLAGNLGYDVDGTTGIGRKLSFSPNLETATTSHVVLTSSISNAFLALVTHRPDMAPTFGRLVLLLGSCLMRRAMVVQ